MFRMQLRSGRRGQGKPCPLCYMPLTFSSFLRDTALGSTDEVGEFRSDHLEMFRVQGVDVPGIAFSRAAQEERIVNAAAGQTLFGGFLDGCEVFPVVERNES